MWARVRSTRLLQVSSALRNPNEGVGAGRRPLRVGLQNSLASRRDAPGSRMSTAVNNLHSRVIRRQREGPGSWRGARQRGKANSIRPAEPRKPGKTNMNLDSIYRLIEETQIFRAPRQSAVQAPCDTVAPASSPRETCHSCLPLDGLQSRAAHDVCARPCPAGDWDICEELWLRELEEVKARAAQMEKTMRWWSDCTANWRAKWGQVRAERDRAREEGRQLRVKLEMAVKELSALKKKQGLPRPAGASGARVTQDLKRPSFPGVTCAQTDQCHMGSQTCESVRECLVERELPAKENADSKEEGLILDPLRLNEEMKLNPDCPNLFKNGGSKDCTLKPGLTPQAENLPLGNEVPKISASQVHLDEFQKILWEEREIRSSLEKEIERLESAVSLWKWKYEELKGSEAKSVNELEKLQAENTSEWHKREILETEKQGLERENRRLKVQVKEMEELLKRKDGFRANSHGPDFQTSQTELQEKNKIFTCEGPELFQSWNKF
uniref:Coiled-coil domain containing 102B n=2 Tax=Rousettus aegyptiacus TaxID=9407 RepID=A0A7J8DFM4_ROUAE|nr:coiled-coil domain containing 102B [Rousettus aegyptiacus]